MRLRQLLLLGLAIALLIVASDALFWLRSAASRVAEAGQPAADATRNARGFFATLGDIQSLRDRVAQLEAENAALQSQLVQERELALTTSLEATELAAAQIYGHAVAASVLHRSPNLFLETLTINRGIADGVTTGAAVLAHGTLVGVIDAVETSRSTVRLITSAGSVIPVRLQVSRAQGLLRGGLGGVIVSDLPADVLLTEDEAVLTSGLGETLPAGLPVGTVGQRLSDESEILQRMTLVSPVKFSGLDVLVVLIPSTEEASS